jgi:pyruvate formate lyase activating enzyme
MQGCPLRCKYCHNRDTWDINSGNITKISDLVDEIKRYLPYIKSSHGGITISGGEPLLQSNFIIDLFKELKKFDIHTAIDTAGSLPIDEKIKELLSLTDLVLLDIKNINDKKCEDLTGLSNKNTLNFARYLSDNHIPVWIRQVIVPGYTDDKNDLLKLKDFLSTLSNIEKIELLPYHELGKFKWKELGFDYPLNDVKPATNEDLTYAKKILGIND